MKNYSCSNCGIINCKHQDSEYPKFCPTKELTSDEIIEIEKLYNEDNTKRYHGYLQKLKRSSTANTQE